MYLGVMGPVFGQKGWWWDNCLARVFWPCVLLAFSPSWKHLGDACAFPSAWGVAGGTCSCPELGSSSWRQCPRLAPASSVVRAITCVSSPAMGSKGRGLVTTALGDGVSSEESLALYVSIVLEHILSLSK